MRTKERDKLRGNDEKIKDIKKTAKKKVEKGTKE